MDCSLLRRVRSGLSRFSCSGPLLKHVFFYGSFWGLWGITYWLRFTGHPAFATVNYLDLPAAETFASGVLKLFIIACVLVIAWRRRNLGARGLFESLAYAWIVFLSFLQASQAIHDLAGAIYCLSSRRRFSGICCGAAHYFSFFLQYPCSRPAVKYPISPRSKRTRSGHSGPSGPGPF